MMLMVTIGPVSAGHIDEVVAEAPIDIRLTFSFGAPELQVARAQQIQRAAENQGMDVAIWGSLSGATDRIGRIFRGSLEAEKLVKAAEPFRIIDAKSVDLNQIDAVPIPGLLAKNIKVGDVITYGDNQCDFRIETVSDDFCVAYSDINLECIGTRSIYFRNDISINSFRDQLFFRELEFVIDNHDIFAGVIIPDVKDTAILNHVFSELAKANLNKFVICSIERYLSEITFIELIDKADYVIIDRAKIALNEGSVNMPQVCWTFIKNSRSQTKKVLIASHIATTVSQGRGSTLSSSELSDLWTLKRAGIGGVILTEETAVNPNFLRAIQLTKQIVGE
jgi:pyruvate kinase